ncbi:hypothetical protein P3W45_001867 [Vairimorpha bombi]
MRESCACSGMNVNGLITIVSQPSVLSKQLRKQMERNLPFWRKRRGSAELQPTKTALSRDTTPPRARTRPLMEWYAQSDSPTGLLGGPEALIYQRLSLTPTGQRGGPSAPRRRASSRVGVQAHPISMAASTPDSIPAYAAPNPRSHRNGGNARTGLRVLNKLSSVQIAIFLWHPAHPTTPQAFDGPISSDKGTYRD